MSEPFICPIPWISLSLGAKSAPRLCCHQTDQTSNDSDPAGSARELMLKNVMPKECSGCHELEKHSCRSPRQDYLERFSFDKSKTAQIKYLDLTVDNDCNLECLMCTPLYSHKLSAFYERQYGVNQEKWTSSFTSGDLLSIASTLEQVTITGGEPFISKKSIEIIEMLADQPEASKIVLRIFTNLTHLPTSTLMKLQSFKRLELILSIDSVRENYEFIRFPAKWEKITTNLRALKDLKIKNLDLHLHSVITAFNWCHIGELIEFFKLEVSSNNILPLFVEIETPLLLHPKVLTEEFYLKGKEDILNSLENLEPRSIQHQNEIKYFKNLIFKIGEADHSHKLLDYHLFLKKVKAHRNRRLSEN